MDEEGKEGKKQHVPVTKRNTPPVTSPPISSREGMQGEGGADKPPDATPETVMRHCIELGIMNQYGKGHIDIEGAVGRSKKQPRAMIEWLRSRPKDSLNGEPIADVCKLYAPTQAEQSRRNGKHGLEKVKETHDL
jgi:hypothetical protein